jgi:hypothetical protein
MWRWRRWRFWNGSICRVNHRLRADIALTNTNPFAITFGDGLADDIRLTEPKTIGSGLAGRLAQSLPEYERRRLDPLRYERRPAS